jgi:hypothetical protein
MEVTEQTGFMAMLGTISYTVATATITSLGAEALMF